MKKTLLFFIIFITFISSAKAFDFELKESYNFDENKWKVNIYDLKIISKNDVFSWSILDISIPDTSRFLFDPELLENILISWKNNKINSKISISNDLRHIYLNVINDLKENEYLLLDKIPLLIYDKEHGYRYLQLKIDDTIKTTINGVKITDNDSQRDVLKPNDILNLNYKIENNKLNITWQSPWDLDLDWVQLLTINNNWIEIKSIRIFDEYYTFDYNKDYNYLLKTVDRKWNRSKWVIIEYKEEESNKTNSEDTEEKQEEEKSQVEDVIIEDNIEPNIEEEKDKVIEISKYIPIFIKYKNTLDKVVIILDEYINKKLLDNSDITKRNNVMIVRNNLMKTLEELDSSNKDNRNSIIKEFKSKIFKLKNEIKK